MITRSTPLPQEPQDILDTIGSVVGTLEGDAREMGVDVDWGTIKFETDTDEERYFTSAVPKYYAHLTVSIMGQKS